MKIEIGRSIKYVFLFHLSALLLIALYTFAAGIRLEMAVLTPAYRIITILTIYSDLFIALTAGALFMLLAVSGRDTAGKRKSGRSDAARSFIASSLPVVIPSALLYLFLIFSAEPMLEEKASWLRHISSAGKFYEREAERLYTEGSISRNPLIKEEKLKNAVHFADLYLFIDPLDRDMINSRSNMLIAYLDQYETVKTSSEIEETDIFTQTEMLTGYKYAELAEDMFNRGDYSTALYYAQIAANFRGSERKGAEITASAKRKLRWTETSPTREQQLYEGKLKLNSLLLENRHTDAYKLYHQLNREFMGGDSELSGLADKLFAELSGQALFYEDISGYIHAPGKENIAFINSTEDGLTEIIFAGKILIADNKIYFINTYVMRISDSGEIVSNQFSNFGKVIERNLVMQTLGRESEIMILPEIITGNPGSAEITIPLTPEPSSLVYLKSDESIFKKMQTVYIAENLASLRSAGYGETAADEEFIIRFVRFFNYILIQILVLASGISFMKRNLKKNYTAFIGLPAAVLLIYLGENGIIFIKSGIIRILLSETGFFTAVIVYFFITAGEISASFVYTVKKAGKIAESAW